MAILRRRLRLCATTWLVFQVAWLMALVPRDCCAAHRPAAKSCHESAEHHTPPAPAADCRLAGTCDGPMAALFALLSNHGILPESTDTPPNADVCVVATAVRENVTGRFESPDPPPPRA